MASNEETVSFILDQIQDAGIFLRSCSISDEYDEHLLQLDLDTSCDPDTASPAILISVILGLLIQA